MNLLLLVTNLQLFSPFLNAFLHLGFFKKHTLNESECIFWGEEGLSGLTVGSVWLIVQGGEGVLISAWQKSPDFRSLEVGISAIIKNRGFWPCFCFFCFFAEIKKENSGPSTLHSPGLFISVNIGDNINLTLIHISIGQGIMLVYDITQEKTFDNISKWLRNIEEVYTCNEGLLLLLHVYKVPENACAWKIRPDASMIGYVKS